VGEWVVGGSMVNMSSPNDQRTQAWNFNIQSIKSPHMVMSFHEDY
jgi:hypothetical protein